MTKIDIGSAMKNKLIIISIFLSVLVSVSITYSDEGHDLSSGGMTDMLMKEVQKAITGEAHDMHGDMNEMKAEEEGDDYIRAISPAGYNPVIGKKNPLHELKPHIMKEDDKTVKMFELTVKDVKFEIFPDKFNEGWGFNGEIPGPTIRVSEGDTVRIVLKNDTDADHTLHVHGQSKSVIMDASPFLVRSL
jgi:FtsP/CotA-like multicopper oxidase with cupredoxin domain